ncbi:PEP-CTERM sorting domain-containing protein [Rubritalea profundi]
MTAVPEPSTTALLGLGGLASSSAAASNLASK